MAISAVILAKNEEENISSAIKSVEWCDEIMVIDDNSTDKTVELAKKHGAQVVTHHLDADFSKQRNFALEHVKNEWVLFIDADEKVHEELKNEILLAVKNSDVDGYYIKRVDTLWGRQLRYGEAGNARFVRLGKRSKGKWVGKVHERWDIDGTVDELTNPLFHYPHKNISDFLRSINFYTTLRAEELYEKKVTASFVSIIVYTKGKFFQNYFFKRGILDGTAGLVHALLMSFHSFLVRAKLWLLWKGVPSEIR